MALADEHLTLTGTHALYVGLAGGQTSVDASGDSGALTMEANGVNDALFGGSNPADVLNAFGSGDTLQLGGGAGQVGSLHGADELGALGGPSQTLSAFGPPASNGPTFGAVLSDNGQTGGTLNGVATTGDYEFQLSGTG
jgi:hypothetical protein